jgi:hypothetical protein
MRRFLSICMVLGVAFCLVFPIHSMAANVNIQTGDGVNTTFSKPYKSFTIDANGNITILYDGTSTDLPDPLQLQPVITISGAGTDNNTGTVTGTKTVPVAFSVAATDTDFNSTNGSTLKLSYIYPGGEEVSPFTLTAASTGTFTKTYSTDGVYYVIFKASFDPDGDGTAFQPFETQRTIAIAIGQQQTCTSTVTAQASGSGGTITSATSQTVNCGSTVTFSGTLTSGATATVSEGNYSSLNGLNWTWGVTAPTTNGQTKNVTITFNSGSTCQSTVTAAASGTGGAITSATSQTVSCGGTATFSGTLTSGATATVSEGNYSSSNGLNWTWGVTAPTTNGQTKNVTITFSTGTPPPGNCSTQDMASRVSAAVKVEPSQFRWDLWVHEICYLRDERGH